MKKIIDNIKLFFALCWHLKVIFIILLALWLMMVGAVKFITPSSFPGFGTNKNPFDWDIYPTTQVSMTCWYDDQPVIFKNIIKISPSDRVVFTPKGQFKFTLSSCSVHTPNTIKFYGN